MFGRRNAHLESDNFSRPSLTFPSAARVIVVRGVHTDTSELDWMGTDGSAGVAGVADVDGCCHGCAWALHGRWHTCIDLTERSMWRRVEDRYTVSH